MRRSWSLRTLNGELIDQNRQPLGTSGLVVPSGLILRVDVKSEALLFVCESTGQRATLQFGGLPEDERKNLRVFASLYERGASIALLNEEEATRPPRV